MKKKFIIIFTVILLITILTKTWITTIKIDGEAMAPALKSDQRWLVNKRAYILVTPKSEDMILFYNSQFQFQSIGRIIGVPNDRIQIENGQVIKNGQALSEPYLTTDTRTEFTKAIAATPLDNDRLRLDVLDTNYYPLGQTIALGPDEYFVMGDNREESVDSRSFGPIKSSDIVGKLVFLLK